MSAVSKKSCDYGNFQAVSKLSVIWKNAEKTDIRLISDYRRSGINRRSSIETTITLPTLGSIMEMVRKCSVVGIVAEYDVKAAFRHIALHKNEQAFLPVTDVRNSAEESILVDRCLPFGHLASPLLWCRLNAAVHRIQTRLMAKLKSDSGTIAHGIVYVDDSTWIIESIDQLVILLLISTAFGITIEYKKVHVLKRDGRCLGFQIDTDTRSVTIPGEKRRSISNEISRMISVESVSVEDLQRITGKLTWLAQLVREWRPLLCALYSLLSICESRGLSKIRWSVHATNVLGRFQTELLEPEALVYPVPEKSTTIWLITDASTQGFGGIIVINGKEYIYPCVLSQAVITCGIM
jgi:hypothetical protein